jgi:hypothetical protein
VCFNTELAPLYVQQADFCDILIFVELHLKFFSGGRFLGRTLAENRRCDLAALYFKTEMLLLLLLCSVEELLNLVIPVKSSTDLDMDPCKSDRFDGRNLEG